MKTVFSFCLLLASVVAGGAQGMVDFRNFGPAFARPADRLVRDVDGTPLVGRNFFAQLYWDRGTANVGNVSPFGTSVTNPPVTFRSPTTTAPGYWVLPAGTSLYRTVGFAETGGGTLQVRVWDSNFGLGFDEAVANGSKWGVSAGFLYTGPGGVEGYYMEDFRGFTLVPEPSFFVLLLLGAALMCWQRNLKAWMVNWPNV